MPVEPDWRLEGIRGWVQTIHQFQTYFNPKSAVPPDWETAWLDGVDALYKPTVGKDAHFPQWFMFHDVMMVSQVRHATKYTTPESIAAHIPELAEEALALRTSGEFETAVTDEYFRVLNLNKPKDELEELTEEQLEKERAKEIKTNAKQVKEWQKWMGKNDASICITA